MNKLEQIKSSIKDEGLKKSIQSKLDAIKNGKSVKK